MKKFLSRSENALEEMIEGTARPLASQASTSPTMKFDFRRGVEGKTPFLRFPNALRHISSTQINPQWIDIDSGMLTIQWNVTCRCTESAHGSSEPAPELER